MKDEIIIVDEGDLNYHLAKGTIEHNYFVDKKRQFATCQCGRVLYKRKNILNETKRESKRVI